MTLEKGAWRPERMPRLGWVGARKRALVAERGSGRGPKSARGPRECPGPIGTPSSATQGALEATESLFACQGGTRKRQEGRSDREAESTLGERDPQGHSWEA